jgi:nicotinamidase-related amidase
MMIDDAQLLQVKATIWAAAYAAWVPHWREEYPRDHTEAHIAAVDMADMAVEAFCNGEEVT